MKLIILSACLFVQLSASFASDAHFLSDDFIADINSNQDQWEAGRNFDPNTPLSDIKILLGAIMEGREKRPEMVKTFDPLWPENKKIPKRFDARKKWHKKCPRIAEVLDQGRCGSCWAIATTQAFTDRYCIKTKGKHQMRLSTANMLSCCSECGFGCSGGWENLAWSYIKKHGLPSGGNWNTSEGCQPYNIQSPCKYSGQDSPYQPCPASHGTPDCQHRCTNGQYTTELKKDYRFGNLAYALPKDEKAIMKDIMAHGSVTAAFKVMDDFPSYKSGVYEPSPKSQPIGGHAVKLLGWGVEKKVPYWLVMNSWNDYWGDHGLVKMRRNHPRIRLEDEVWAAVPDTKKSYEDGVADEDSEDFEALEDSSAEIPNEEEEVEN
ncbi:unnamed protein product [Bemisia tabaci]|uniref:Peptidase C1A papain C-terminal domain-containing protein n=1 Tax=Bemisia tabaci TaxID=7038 RepID=A0A9P0A6B7_BEMTA|nr:unnamed protein product [Bemisia tabaci]